jgi:hypothetical protein
VKALPDLGLGMLFFAAWLDLFDLGSRRGSSLMLLIEIEGYTLVVSLIASALAYSLATDEQWQEKAKSFFALVFFCTLPPLYFALRWHLWWPILAFGALLWNRLRVAYAGADAARRLRVPVRELVLYAGAAMASMWLVLPALGSASAQFHIADYPGWCHAPEALLPDDLIDNNRVVSWCAAPYRALAAGTLYYGLSGLLTLLSGPYRFSLLWGWVRRDPEE